MAGILSPKIRIDSVSPPAAIPGGQLTIRGSGLGSDKRRQPVVSFGGVPGRLVVSTPDRLVVTIPDSAETGSFNIRSARADRRSTRVRSTSSAVPSAVRSLRRSRPSPVPW